MQTHGFCSREDLYLFTVNNVAYFLKARFSLAGLHIKNKIRDYPHGPEFVLQARP